MILLNFGSRLQKMSFEQITAISGLNIIEQIMLPIEKSGVETISEMDKLFRKVNLTNEELCRERLAMVPSPSPIVTALVIVELKKRTGMYPYLIHTRPSLGGFRFGVDIADVIDLEQRRGFGE